jgi:general secretion pathway protein J
MLRRKKIIGVRFNLSQDDKLNLTPIRGFTLIEVMVAIGVLALMAVLSWRGLDGMARAQEQTQVYADEVQTLQTGLAQWSVDLDALLPVPQANAIDWDGRVLRLTRSSSNASADGLLVVAWTRRVVNGVGMWLRWQSPPLRSRAALTEAWTRAALWAQNPGDEEKKREVAIVPLAQWQIFYFRNDAWSNPLSSDSIAAGAATMPAATGAGIPDGVRLVLTLPPGGALRGTLTRDWVQPTVGGGKS